MKLHQNSDTPSHYDIMTLKKTDILGHSSSLVPNNEIFGVSGSPRKNGNSDILLKSIISGAADEGTPATCCNLMDIKFQGCIGCEKCRRDKICTGLVDGMSILYNRIISSKGLVVVSPTHNYNITSWMKAFIIRSGFTVSR